MSVDSCTTCGGKLHFALDSRVEQVLSYTLDIHGDGRWFQELYYIASPQEFETYKIGANEILQSIQWKKSDS